MMTELDSRPAATPAEVEAAWQDTKLAQVLYHDWEAHSYDEKWSISFDQRCIDYAHDRFVAVAGTDGWPYRRSLEIGCVTGFFTLNLKLAGVLDECHVTDISGGMVEAAQRNATTLGFEIEAGLRTPSGCRTTTPPSTWSSGMPSSTTSRTWSSPSARCCGSCGPVGGWSSVASRRRTATSWRGASRARPGGSRPE
jgi:hypothetical protein